MNSKNLCTDVFYGMSRYIIKEKIYLMERFAKIRFETGQCWCGDRADFNLNISTMNSQQRLMSAVVAQVCFLIEVLDEEEVETEQNFETLCIARRLTRIPRIPNYVENIIPQFNDELFQSHFRMRRSTFDYLLQLIRHSLLRRTIGRRTIEPEKQLLIAIWRMATPDSYRSICEKFIVSKSTALSAVRRVTRAINEYSSVFITWPDSERRTSIINGFSSQGFPGVIGAIDGTHIKIKAPHVNPEGYVDRKGHHSIQLQAICDHRMRFIHCYAGQAGSVHDQRVFRLSEISDYIKDNSKFDEDNHLIGDSAYALHKHVMTPYRDNGHLSEAQQHYNYCHSSTRMAIERAFGLLKSRFRSLLGVLDLRRVDEIPDYIIACCILHNICLMQNDDLNDVMQIQGEDNIRHAEFDVNRNEGRSKRDRICENLIRNA